MTKTGDLFLFSLADVHPTSSDYFRTKSLTHLTVAHCGVQGVIGTSISPSYCWDVPQDTSVTIKGGEWGSKIVMTD